MRAFAASLFVSLLVAGCSDVDEPREPGVTATWTATPSPETGGQHPVVAPPAAYIVDVTDREVAGGTGTFCWPQSTTAVLCADLWGPRTNVTPIPVVANEDLAFIFDAGLPREVNLDWTPADQLTSGQSGPPGSLDWGLKDGASYSGPEYTKSRAAPSERGLYVLQVFTLFPEGDVTYGFYVEVQ